MLSSHSIKRMVDVTTSGLGTLLRTGMGINAEAASTRPRRLLELYDIEASPFCRLVREALTELDLDAVVYPCPTGGERFRPKVIKLGGKAQFPFLVDPNAGEQMYESMDIVRYLFATYGARPLPLKWQLGPLQILGSGLTSVARLGQGHRAVPSRRPSKRLELFSFESSPYARLVRERLCELEIPYVLRNTGRSELRDWLPPPVRQVLEVDPSATLHNRKRLLSEAGRVSIPYLVDPNTETAMFESAAILRHLDATYGM